MLSSDHHTVDPGFRKDSESMYQEIIKDICASHGKKYTHEHEIQIRGSTDAQVSEFLVKEFNLNMTPNALEREIVDLSNIKLPHSGFKKGAERLLRHLYDNGIPFALATNSTRRAIRQHIFTKPCLFSMFHHMVCVGDPDVDRGKPHPDIYLVAASKFAEKPKPRTCLVFEDSLVGLDAALAAGMQVVMTPHFRIPSKYFKKATLVLESLLDFKPEVFGLPPFVDIPDNPPKKRSKGR